jgi:hypothetical protein
LKHQSLERALRQIKDDFAQLNVAPNLHSCDGAGDKKYAQHDVGRKWVRTMTEWRDVCRVGLEYSAQERDAEVDQPEDCRASTAKKDNCPEETLPDGGPLAAWRIAQQRRGTFSDFFIADANEESLSAYIVSHKRRPVLLTRAALVRENLSVHLRVHLGGSAWNRVGETVTICANDLNKYVEAAIRFDASSLR